MKPGHRVLSSLSVLLALAMASTLSGPSALDALHVNTRTLALFATAAAAVYTAWAVTHLRELPKGVDATHTLLGRATPAPEDTICELRDLPQRRPPAPPAARWPLLHAPPSAPPAYLARIADRLKRAARAHGLALTADAHGALTLHPPSAPAPALLLRADGTLRVALHTRDAAQACAKGWARAAGPGAVEIRAPPRDGDELAVVLEIVDAGVKYLRARAADMLCDEILDMVF